MLNNMATLIEAVHDAVVGDNEVAVVLGWEGFSEYGVSVSVVGEYDVLVVSV